MIEREYMQSYDCNRTNLYISPNLVAKRASSFRRVGLRDLVRSCSRYAFPWTVLLDFCWRIRTRRTRSFIIFAE
ncbi:hypothetical protein MPTK1_6g05450 [Marchantia polymorpha subsp. ruderalis]|uniref:Uncharacterized protein n=2 Tax=Marchantia polymorpha TaxID=3197 RepID=A0AAF6BNT4_MARPO|nr:hypothetical protein MARPO_0167s0027 [Marchantia polymorpha]BBN13668.1 hypothetical protein Mp_6g05450 [Marchantia polymorpha subsp. ruderalis]|eukprot:PTQ28337.1 hypothetical protein MARPO_0167s0027 [Marchantia polymorpha]